MKKTKYLLLIILLALVALVFIPNTSNATVSVNKEVYANNGSTKFYFSGLTLDKTHEYEFGMTKTAATAVTKWHLITVYTENTATIDITAATKEFTDVIVATETGYITIKDKTSDTVVLQPYAVDLSIPYLNLANYNVINNGKNLSANKIEINFWNASNSKPYYQYEKITDENVINKYKEIKKKNGNYNDLQSLLKKNAPSSNWRTWEYWNGYGGSNTSGYGYTQRAVNMSENGLYYMWIYLAGNNVRNAYGYILVDNLENEIALTSISLPSTKEVELGKTLTLTPTFNPSNTTDKTVTWTSSDESVATVNNSGVVTPKKVGSTIITVTSKQGKKTARCTVTVKGTSTTTADGWTDTSNTKIKFIDSTIGNNQSVKICIEGITTNKDSQYYLYLTNGNNKPTLSVSDTNFINKGYYTSQDATRFQNFSQSLTSEGEQILEKNGDIYAWIVESKLNSDNKRENKFILESYKVERPALLKLGERFSVYFSKEETSVFNHNINGVSNKERKLKVKIGTISDNSILKAIKNNESGNLGKLLTYSKSAKSTYTGTLPMNESTSIVDKIGVVDGQYYYAYFELDDENGKYYPIEDVMLYQGKVDSSTKVLLNYKDAQYKWNITDDSTSTPTDTTITPDKKLPQTGEKIAIIGTIGIAAVVTIVLGIKAKKYNF